MFDFSFSELMVALVVALVVVGPERLPKVARALGHLYGRAQRYVNGVKTDIARDMAIEEFRQLQQKVQAEASAIEQSVQQAAQALDQQVQQLNRAVAQPPANSRSPTQLPLPSASQSADVPPPTPPAKS